MISKFNHLPWHDANLQHIFIDRQNPGEQDIVKLLIHWPDDQGASTLEFYDCYFLNLNMNFGIIACESILKAECVDDSDELRIFRKEWQSVGVNLDNLKCFKIITNSTNSTITVYALRFQIIPGNCNLT